MTRAWPIPTEGETIHFIGDMHFGGISATRTDKIAAMYHAARCLPDVRATVQLGDLVHNGLSSEDTAALAWMDDIDPDWLLVIGGHDFWNYVRTPAEAAAALGTELHYTVDYDTFRLIVLDPDTLGGNLPTATLDFLDDSLSGTPLDCWIACHYPLYDTVTSSDPTNYYRSVDGGFYALPDSDIRTILAAHTNAKAWIAGHTHTPISEPTLVSAVTVGSHKLASINCSSPYYVGKTAEAADPMNTLYVTRRPDGTIDVRFRNWGAGIWDAQNGSRVLTPSLV